LLFAALVAVVVGSWIWDIEELPEVLVIADVAVILVLMGYLLKLARSQVARRKKSKEDVLVQRIRQTFESAQLSDVPQRTLLMTGMPF
jgi:membrane protein YdbS with pleckstrin-like domain